MFRHCSVSNCKSVRQDVKFHAFPSENNRLKKWLDSIRSESLRALSVDEIRKRYVCHKHFEKRFVTSKSRLLSIAYPTLFSEDEIATGIASVYYENIENQPIHFEHNYARKRHYDHSYSKPMPRSLNVLKQIPNPPDMVLPSGSKTFDLNHDSQCNVTEVTSANVLVPPSSCSSNEKEIPVLNNTKLQFVKESRMKSTMKHKRNRLVNKVSRLSKECKEIYDQYKKSRNQLNFIARAKRAIKFSKSDSFEKLTKNMGEYSKKLFWMQIKMCTKSKKARRFTLEEKIIALSILKQSPKCYRFLKKIFILPSRTTLKKLVSNLNIESGLNKQIFGLIKLEVETWKEEKKFCTIIFDEMALEPGLTYTAHKDKITGFVEVKERKRQFADHALVFMAKGATCKWQQPLGFYFCAGATSSKDMKTIIKEIVKAVGDTGLIPIALISDQGSAFQSALKSLQQDTRRQQILANEVTDSVISLDGFNLSVIYDPPHLIKGLRNNFLTKDILFEDNIAKWSDIVDVYKADCCHAETRLLHKLNDEHVIPEKIKKMKVKNCVRVFSRTMAAALAYTSQFSHYIDGTPVSQSLKNTANVVRFLDDLFDSVNGTSLQQKKSRGKDLPRAVTQNSRHQIFWKQAILKLKSLKFLDKKGKQITVPSLNNWITTLESFLRLWQFFKNNNISVMRPRFFNSDSIENFFGQVRAYNLRSNNPDCHSFINTFKSLLITGFIKFHNESFNCEDDNFNQLLKINHLFSENFSQSDDMGCSNNSAPSCAGDTVRNSIEEARRERLNIHSRAYTAGWVVRKILLKINCELCKNKLTSDSNENIHKWINNKEYKKITQTKLIYPSESVVRSFGAILKGTNEYLEVNAHKFNISEMIKEVILSNNDLNEIACESHQTTTTQLFLHITIRLAIFNWCNIINKILKGTDILRLQKRVLPTMQSLALTKFQKKWKKINK